jgi:spore maturation protein CgeB
MPERHGLRIAFFGSSLVSSYWNGAATYYRGLLRALAARGHEITFYEPDAFERQQHRDMAEDPPWASVVVYPPFRHSAAQALASAQEADVIVKASGVGVLDEWLEREVLNSHGRRSRCRALKIFWDVDAPATLERLRNDPDDPFRALIPHYDAVFTYGGGQPVVDAYSRLGARLCQPIYNALDPATHYPVEPDPRFRGALGFLGNRLPDREARVHEFFFKTVAALPRSRFLLGGSGWDNGILPFDNLHVLGHVYTCDHNAFNCSPLAILNINRDSMARNGFSPPTRVFEAAGAGACLIMDRWAGVEEFLQPDSEVLLAASGAEVIAHLQGLTAEKARRIGAAARQKILDRHTYERRALQVENILQTALSARALALA